MLSPERIERLRGYLLTEQESLHKQMASLEAAAQEPSVGLGNHMAEDATAAFDQATVVSLHRGHELALQQVEAALARMANGTYGKCQRCGEEIDFARLKAVPEAGMCLSCQRIVEL
jgi:DnaK suppressor protein